MPGLDHADAHVQARRVADQLAGAVARPAAVAGPQVTVSVSVGVAVFPDDRDDFAALLHHADLRMYAAKHPEPGSRAAAVTAG